MNYFITLEGSEGVGKSTVMAFIKTYLEQKKMPCLFTREPGGTWVGEKIRDILLLQNQEPIESKTELLLLFAARAQHIAQVIQPALDAGKTVVSDRFTDASFAYQGGGRGIPTKEIAMLVDYVQKGLNPDLTILLDAPVEVGLARMNQRGEKDRIEKESADFFNRVRQAYLERAKQFPKRFVIVNADLSIEAVQAQIGQALDALIKVN